jgi:hypothetical protein
MSNNDIMEFSIDNIPKILEDNKTKLINLVLSLDRHEISKDLTNSLNIMLMGNKTNLMDVYEIMVNNFDDISNKVDTIEKKIMEFNSTQSNSYVVDPDNILYVVFFKQIIYIKQLVKDINMLICSNINLVFIYAYLISMLYNEPEKITSNYILILKNIVSDTKFMAEHDNKLKEFLGANVIDKIYITIKIIYNSDKEFDKLLVDLKNQKLEEYRKNNGVDLSDSFKEIEKLGKDIKGGSINIYDIEEKFIKKRNYIMSKKRNIVITNLYDQDNVKLIIGDNISIELWFGYNLFVYKRFNFNFDDYQSKINKILESDGLSIDYFLNLDYFNDIETPYASMLLPNSTNMIGGSNHIDYKYYLKYLKYKNKYLKLKNNKY